MSVAESKRVDPRLRDFATPAQLAYLDAIDAAGGSVRGAATALGRAPSTLREALGSLMKRAARQGYAPGHWSSGVAPGYHMGKITVQRAADGEVERAWERQLPDGDAEMAPVPEGHIAGKVTIQEGPSGVERTWRSFKPDDVRRDAAIRAAFDAMAEVLPRQPRRPAPKRTLASLCNLYTMTDCHVGMLAWHQEGGANWDLKIAERVLTDCFGQMIAQSPAAETCVINQLGDWLHFDGLDAVTPTNRHVLDADARFQKIVVASLRILRRIVDMALSRHKRVYIVMAEGNHDLASSVWLRTMFAALYEREPRVVVNDSALPFYQYRHGRTVLWFHHGHLKKFEGLPGLFAAQFPEAWGETSKRYIHMGHCHHEKVQEFPGVKVVQHPTLAARDAYASRHGYLSERQATAYTYHSEYGQVGSVTVTPEMLASEGDAA